MNADATSPSSSGFWLGLLRSSALYALALVAALPLIAATAPAPQAASLCLSSAVLFLIPFGVALSEEGKSEGVVATLGESLLWSWGSLVLPLVVALAVYQRTERASLAASLLLISILWTQAFLHLSRPLSQHLVIGSSLLLVLAGIASGAPWAARLMPLSFALFATVTMIDQVSERLRRHGRADAASLTWPAATAGILAASSLVLGSLSFQVFRLVRERPSTPPPPIEEPSVRPRGSRQVMAKAPPGGEGVRLAPIPATPGPRSPGERPRSPEAPTPSPLKLSPVPVLPIRPGQPSLQDGRAGARPPPQPAHGGRQGTALSVTQPGSTLIVEGGVEVVETSRQSPEPEIPVPTWRERLAPLVPHALAIGGLGAALAYGRLRRRRRRSHDGEGAESTDARASARSDARPGFFHRLPRDPRARIIHFFNQVFEEGRPMGIEDHFSAEEIALRLQGRLARVHFHILLLVRAFEQAKYSRSPISADLCDSAEEAARAILREMRRVQAAS